MFLNISLYSPWELRNDTWFAYLHSVNLGRNDKSRVSQNTEERSAVFVIPFDRPPQKIDHSMNYATFGIPRNHSLHRRLCFRASPWNTFLIIVSTMNTLSLCDVFLTFSVFAIELFKGKVPFVSVSCWTTLRANAGKRMASSTVVKWLV